MLTGDNGFVQPNKVSCEYSHYPILGMFCLAMVPSNIQIRYIVPLGVLNGFQASKEVQKSNFRQYGRMKKQRWEEPTKRKEEEIRTETRQEEEARSRCAKRQKSRETLCFSMVLWGVPLRGRVVVGGNRWRWSMAVVGRWSVDHGIPITLSIEYGLQFYNQ